MVVGGAKGVSREASDERGTRACLRRYYGTPGGGLGKASHATPKQSGRSERRSANELCAAEFRRCRCKRRRPAGSGVVRIPGGNRGKWRRARRPNLSLADGTSARCLRAHSAGARRRLHNTVPSVRAMLYARRSTSRRAAMGALFVRKEEPASVYCIRSTFALRGLKMILQPLYHSMLATVETLRPCNL